MKRLFRFFAILVIGAIALLTLVVQLRSPSQEGDWQTAYGVLPQAEIDGGFVDCLCFASNWGAIRSAIKVGNLISIGLDYERGSAIYNGAKIRLIEKIKYRQLVI